MPELQKQVYDYIVSVLNLNTQGITFKSGYHISIYNGVPSAIDDSGENLFDWNVKEVVPVSEEYSNETPMINKSDRADFASSYNFMFRLRGTMLSNVRTALGEYRDYMLANKQTVIDGYTISFKVTRGNKLPTLGIQDGSFYGFYNIKVYYTAIKDGYIYKDTDKLEFRQFNTGDYVDLVEVQHNIATSYNANPDNETTTITHYNTSGVYTNKIQIFYDGSDLHKLIDASIKNKGNVNEAFDLKETFDGVTSQYKVIITGGARTVSPNGVAILEFDVREVK